MGGRTTSENNMKNNNKYHWDSLGLRLVEWLSFESYHDIPPWRTFRKINVSPKKIPFQRGKQSSNQPFSGATLVLGCFRRVSFIDSLSAYFVCYHASHVPTRNNPSVDKVTKKRKMLCFFDLFGWCSQNKNNPPSMVVWWWFTLVEFERKQIQNCDVLDRHLSSDFPDCGRNPAPPEVFFEQTVYCLRNKFSRATAKL